MLRFIISLCSLQTGRPSFTKETMVTLPTSAYDEEVQRQLAATLVGLLITGLGAFALIIAHRMIRSSSSFLQHETKSSERLAFIDNAKFICIIGVVFGRFTYYNLDHSSHIVLLDYKTWLKGAEPLLRSIPDEWSINLFCFISGYLSRSPFTVKRCKNLVVGLIIPTLLWSFFVKPCIFPLLSIPQARLWPKL